MNNHFMSDSSSIAFYDVDGRNFEKCLLTDCIVSIILLPMLVMTAGSGSGNDCVAVTGGPAATVADCVVICGGLN